ncbi:hypothetical protein [Streptosporangium saharense]|uniref:hypothetical protein n=1 Tax=Streptosporangium saharense TaxID=1706840 RepID=UPI00332D387D
MALTDARLAEIRARRAATTPGPWAIDAPYYWPGDDDPHVSSVAVDADCMPVLLPAPGAQRGEADLAFAVHAHHDVTDLVVEVEQLRELIAALTDPDPCAYDHHGSCQTHGQGSDPYCAHGRAQALLPPEARDA